MQAAALAELRDFTASIPKTSACAKHPELFQAEDKDAEQAAKYMCGRCPMLEACRDFGLRRRMEGVWGGLSEDDRTHLRRSQAASRSRAKRSKPAAPVQHTLDDAMFGAAS